MHGSHKLWITVAIFLVVIGLLLGMYFTATSDKVGSVISNKSPEKIKELVNKKKEMERVKSEGSASAQNAQNDNVLPDEIKSLDLDSIKAENADYTQEQADNTTE